MPPAARYIIKQGGSSLAIRHWNNLILARMYGNRGDRVTKTDISNMATSLDENCFGGFYEHYDDFHCDVDESEALADLESLDLSDHELFVESGMIKNDSAACRPNVSINMDGSIALAANASIGSNGNMMNDIENARETVCGETTDTHTDANACPKCGKVYKRAKTLKNHVAACPGKHEATKAASRSRARQGKSKSKPQVQ